MTAAVAATAGRRPPGPGTAPGPRPRYGPRPRPPAPVRLPLPARYGSGLAAPTPGPRPPRSPPIPIPPSCGLISFLSLPRCATGGEGTCLKPFLCCVVV